MKTRHARPSAAITRTMLKRALILAGCIHCIDCERDEQMRKSTAPTLTTEAPGQAPTSTQAAAGLGSAAATTEDAGTIDAALEAGAPVAALPIDARAECPPPRVEMDGVAVKTYATIGNGFIGHPDVYTITVTARPVDCRVILSGSRTIKLGELNVDIGYGIKPIGQQFVFYENSPEPRWTVTEFEGPLPKKVGDSIAICVRGPVIRIGMAGRRVTIDGLFRARYCGAL